MYCLINYFLIKNTWNSGVLEWTRQEHKQQILLLAVFTQSYYFIKKSTGIYIIQFKTLRSKVLVVNLTKEGNRNWRRMFKKEENCFIHSFILLSPMYIRVGHKYGKGFFYNIIFLGIILVSSLSCRTPLIFRIKYVYYNIKSN